MKTFLENDDNLLYFPSINNLNRQQQTFLSGSNTNNGLFNDILPNNNPISTLSTNTFVNNRQQPYKPISTMAYPQQQQQQHQMRNDENAFHNNHQHASSVRISFYELSLF
jgi:hypothetical protein